MSEELEFAWAVGLFEGEGSIVVLNGRDRRRLQLGSTDLDVVMRFHRIVGVGHVGGPYEKNVNWKPIYTWHAGAWNDVRDLLLRMLPMLGARRRAAAEAVLADPPKFTRVLSNDDACGRGHEWTSENTYVRASGTRECRACKKERARSEA